MVNKKYFDNNLETMRKRENREKYEKLCESSSGEDEMIKFHLKRIQRYFSLEDEEQRKNLNISDCSLSIDKVKAYFEANGWK